jgi:RND family efflux transporter MFP subunit
MTPTSTEPAPAARPSRLARAVALGAAILASCLLAGCGRKKSSPPPAPPPEVDVAKPIVRDVTEWDEFTGRLQAVNRVEVRPRVSGYLESVNFKEGQIVKKGDLLFVIDPRPFKAVLAAAQAELDGARTRLELAKNEVERAQGALASHAISAEEFDRRNKMAVEAESAVEGAQAEVERAQLDLEFTSVRSPIDGRASNYGVTVGNLVTGGTSGGEATLLTVIVSIDPIQCYFEAHEQEYLKYTRLAASGARPSSRVVPNPVRVALADEADFRHEGHMDFVDNRIDRETGTIRARAILPNPDGLLVPGLFVRLRLIGETLPNALLIPDQAIGNDQANRVVYVVDDKNIVSLRIVQPGRLIDGLRLIRSGLDGTERIVVRGVQRARPGSPVAPTVVDANLFAAGAPAAAPPPVDAGKTPPGKEGGK